MPYKAAHAPRYTELMHLDRRSASSLCCIASRCIDIHSKRLHTHASHAEKGASRSGGIHMHSRRHSHAYTCIASRFKCRARRMSLGRRGGAYVIDRFVCIHMHKRRHTQPASTACVQMHWRLLDILCHKRLFWLRKVHAYALIAPLPYGLIQRIAVNVVFFLTFSISISATCGYCV